MNALGKVVEQCCFKVDISTSEYHPLALKVLGVRVGPVAQEWQKFDFKQYTKENIHPIFSILRSGYVALRPLYQRMFIDLAVYQADWTSHAYFYNVWRYVHGERDEDALVKLLKELLVKSLIEHCDLNSGKVYIHDLCRDFIQMEVESEVKHNPRCYLFQTNNQRYFQACRLRIQHQGITELTEGILCTCSKAELLSLEECDYLRLVDVRGMSNLALLQINKCPQLTSIFVEGVKTLRSISWDGFQGDYPSLTGSESLESLELKSNKDWPNIPPTNSDLSYCCNLENLHLSNIPLSQEMANINSLVKLRRLSIGNCQQLKRVYGLEAAKFIQVIVLEGCSSLLEFPSLVNFRFLQYFVLSNATVLKKLHGISGFSLTHLLLRNATQLEDLLGIQAFTTLKYLNLSNTGIEDFSWISNMKELRVINLSGTRLKILPNHKHLHKLEELQLNNCVALEDLDKDFDISPSLREFRMWNCPNLKTLPQFKISSLIYLCICDAKVEDISGIQHCLHLQKIDFDILPVKHLPDLKIWPCLKIFTVQKCQLLTRLDNVKSLPALEILMVINCASLIALPDLSSSQDLINSYINVCPLLNLNLVKLPDYSFFYHQHARK